MKANELRQMPVEELEVKLDELEEEQLRRRCNKVIQQLDNTSLITEGRRDIARVKTIINEKNRQQQSA
ncbi:50S ribosomal protein L29 [Deltaproteobacteria bacterium TL4]